MSSTKHVAKIVRFIRSNGIRASTAPNYGYSHMGATLSDAVLQAGLNYKTVVKPRVERLLERYPKATTTTQLMDLLDEYGAEHLLNWGHPEKPARLVAITNFMYVRSIETERCLREWFQSSGSAADLEEIRGVGPKTVDYLKMLAGLSAVAVDRHLASFVHRAGFRSNDYNAIRRVLEGAADRLQVDRTSLDYAIWAHVSGNGGANASYSLA
jgi:endonuclease III